ncbi:MAG: pilin [Wenzhouxiangellaceae bacterium]
MARTDEIKRGDKKPARLRHSRLLLGLFVTLAIAVTALGFTLLLAPDSSASSEIEIWGMNLAAAGSTAVFIGILFALARVFKHVMSVLIVVCVVGIVLAISVPTYQDYSARSEVSEGLNAAAALKIAASEFFAANSRLPTREELRQIVDLSSTTKEDFRLIPEDGGKILIEYDVSKLDADDLDELTITWAPTIEEGGLEWHCTVPPAAEKYVPAACR